MQKARKSKGHRQFSKETEKLVASKSRTTIKRQVGKTFVGCKYKGLRYKMLPREKQSLMIHLYPFSCHCYKLCNKIPHHIPFEVKSLKTKVTTFYPIIKTCKYLSLCNLLYHLYHSILMYLILICHFVYVIISF